jgi:hypothetical protein
MKYTNSFHYKTLQNLPKLGFLVWKKTIWHPCLLAGEGDCQHGAQGDHTRPSFAYNGPIGYFGQLFQNDKSGLNVWPTFFHGKS